MTRQIITPPLVECPDDFRCGQTVIMMILMHFYPERAWTWEDADKICAYKPDHCTWCSATIPGMLTHGFEVIYLNDFDRSSFIENPKRYARKNFSAAEIRYIIEHGSFENIVEIEKRILNNTNSYHHLQRDWTWQDIDVLLDAGFLLFTWVDAYKLYNRFSKNIMGHFVLIYGYTPEKNIVMYHDGGSTISNETEGNFQCNVLKGMRIGTDHFMHAAKSADGDHGAVMIAFRPKQN